MQKLNMHTPDFTAENIKKLAEMFPSCVTETYKDDGSIKHAIDFDQLRQELFPFVVEGQQERYQLDWPGKRESLLIANAPIAKTLRPYREESVDFDTTKNLFIEGDNLDVLKLLQETYLNKVKMIYIDPPYNTGNDFIYEDDFAEDTESYFQRSNQKDRNGNRMVINSESNGRFHSDWLSMLYSRLKLARNLLSKNGVIFISIDDNEVANLRKICDEIFGCENFVSQLIWRRRASSAMANNNISADHDYVVCYQKGNFEGFIGIVKDFKNYSNPDNDKRGPWVLGDLTVGMTASMRPNQAYNLTDPKTGNVFPYNPNRVWAYIPSSMKKMVDEGRVIFPDDPKKRPMQKRFKKELKSTYNPLSSLLLDKVGLNTEATRTMQELMGGNLFDYSKPLSLLKTLIPQIANDNDIILDFFSGSATTAHAVMDLNAKDAGKRRYIMVQLPEACDEKSEAFRAGYTTISEIGKERIRRAGKKIKEENVGNEDIDKLDVGFRALKIDSSNIKDVYSTPDSIKQRNILEQIDNIHQDRTSEDLLFQVLLDWGVDLSLPISQKTISGKTVFFVDDNALIACFDSDINESLVKEFASYKPLRVVFRDSSFSSDSMKINVDQIFKLISPSTEVKSI